MRLLLKGSGDSDLIEAKSEDWLCTLRIVHQVALNRNDIHRCRIIENWLLDYSLQYRKATHLCSFWERKNERLVKQGLTREAFISINKLIKYSEKHGLIYRTVHDYILLVQLLIVCFYSI